MKRYTITLWPKGCKPLKTVFETAGPVHFVPPNSDEEKEKMQRLGGVVIMTPPDVRFTLDVEDLGNPYRGYVSDDELDVLRWMAGNGGKESIMTAAGRAWGRATKKGLARFENGFYTITDKGREVLKKRSAR